MPPAVDQAIKLRAPLIMARKAAGYYYTSTDKEKYWKMAETAVLEGVLKQFSSDPDFAGVTEIMIKRRLYE